MLVLNYVVYRLRSVFSVKWYRNVNMAEIMLGY